MQDWLSIEELYNAYLDCRKHKRGSISCARFEQKEASELALLHRELNDYTYKIGTSEVFCVTRPKLREVFAANFRDRIVHHLVISRLLPLLESHFIDDTYNCRKGRGTDYGIKRFSRAMSEHPNGWVLMCDIKGFFMSIDRIVLKEKLIHLIQEEYHGKDKAQMQWLVDMIVLNRPEKNSIRKGDLKLWEGLDKDKSLFTCGDNKGLPIGNLTSQIFGNFYLAEFDDMMTRLVGSMGSYGRYVDDFFVVSDDKDLLFEVLSRARVFLKDKLQLTLHPRKVYLQPVRHGGKFIGGVAKQGRVYVGNRTVSNMMNFMENDKGKDIEKFVQSYNSYNGFMLGMDTYAIRWNAFKSIPNPYKKKVVMVGKMHHLKVRNKHIV